MTIPIDLLVEAKREVTLLARQGKLLSPRDAWLLSGHTSDAQTLWSIASRLAEGKECSAQELCATLERIYPQYTEAGGHPQTWHGYLDRPSHW